MRSQPLKRAQKKYAEKNKPLMRKLARDCMKRKYDEKHLEDSTLRSIRKLFV